MNSYNTQPNQEYGQWNTQPNQEYGQWNTQPNQGYEQQYAQPTKGFDIMSYSPQALLWNQAKCMAIGIVVFIVLMWILSRIPVVGPWISDAIKYIITKLAVLAGVINCGFQNDFNDVLVSETG
jgi:hypothetical protein